MDKHNIFIQCDNPQWLDMVFVSRIECEMDKITVYFDDCTDLDLTIHDRHEVYNMKKKIIDAILTPDEKILIKANRELMAWADGIIENKPWLVYLSLAILIIVMVYETIIY